MPTRSSSAVAADLVGRFRRQRPLRAGSLIVTIFGDSIMPRGGAIALGSLIPLASLFGLNERLVRTATARLAQEGWLAARRVGKRSEYRLSDGGRERFAEATERIYGDPANEGSGRWTLIVLPPMPVAAAPPAPPGARAGRASASSATACSRTRKLPARALAWQIREANLPDRTLVFEADLASPATPAPLVEARLGSRGSRRALSAFRGALRPRRSRARCAARAPDRLHRAHAADPRVSAPASARSFAARPIAAGGLARAQGGRALPLDLRARIRGLGGSPLGGRRAARRRFAARRPLHPAALRRVRGRRSGLNPFR